MSRYYVPISLKDLKTKIESHLVDGQVDFRHLTPVISKDLDKVNFSTENFEYKAEYAHGPAKDLIGYHMLSNRMPILGIVAGGDWEWPLFFCIYFDGKKLRAYIPEKGNTWNTDTKEAFGNDNKADWKNAKKRWPDTTCNEFDEDDEVEPIGDSIKIAKDIMDHIIKKPVKLNDVVVKLVLKPTEGWDKQALQALINAKNGCNIPGLGGEIYQGQRVIAVVTSVDIK